MNRITQVLSVGPFAAPDRAGVLLANGVTHVLNVSESPGELAAEPARFREVVWVPMSDSRVIPEETAVEALDALHRMASEPGAHVYVHCMAGQMRSPTLLWLYLVACGYPTTFARELIETRAPAAAAGHERLVDDALVLHVQMHGLMNYLPLVRGEIIAPFE